MILSIEQLEAEREALDYWTCCYCYEAECVCIVEGKDEPFQGESI